MQTNGISSPQNISSESQPPSSTGNPPRSNADRKQAERRTAFSPQPPIGNLYLVRHAQALHNADGNLNHHDPPITLNGVYQCLELRKSFPHTDSIGQIISSPLQRTLQTTLISFAHLLSSDHYKGWTSPTQMTDCTHPDDKDKPHLGISSSDAKPGVTPVPLEIVPQLQERSNWPADTPSEPSKVHAMFPFLSPLITACEEAAKTENGGQPWWIHKGFYSTRPEHIRARGVWCRRFFHQRLLELGGKDLVVVTHGGFLKTLMQDESHEWRNCGWKGFKTYQYPNEEDNGDSEDVVELVPIPGDVDGVEDLRELAGEKGYMRLEGIEVYDTIGGEPEVEEKGRSVLEDGEKTSEDKAEVSTKEKEEKSGEPTVEEKNEGLKGAEEASAEKINRT